VSVRPGPHIVAALDRVRCAVSATEGPFAEVIRRPGLIDALQPEWHIMVAGPTTLVSLLVSLRVGFLSLRGGQECRPVTFPGERRPGQNLVKRSSLYRHIVGFTTMSTLMIPAAVYWERLPLDIVPTGNDPEEGS
jgi:hypothetical protein